jgi:hypothetical protein
LKDKNDVRRKTFATMRDFEEEQEGNVYAKGLQDLDKGLNALFGEEGGPPQTTPAVAVKEKRFHPAYNDMLTFYEFLVRDGGKVGQQRWKDAEPYEGIAFGMTVKYVAADANKEYKLRNGGPWNKETKLRNGEVGKVTSVRQDGEIKIMVKFDSHKNAIQCMSNELMQLVSEPSTGSDAGETESETGATDDGALPEAILHEDPKQGSDAQDQESATDSTDDGSGPERGGRDAAMQCRDLGQTACKAQKTREQAYLRLDRVKQVREVSQHGQDPPLAVPFGQHCEVLLRTGIDERGSEERPVVGSARSRINGFHGGGARPAFPVRSPRNCSYEDPGVGPRLPGQASRSGGPEARARPAGTAGEAEADA